MSTLSGNGEETLPIVNAVRSAKTVLEEDVWIYRIVVIALGIAVLGALGGAIAIELVTRETLNKVSLSTRNIE